MLANLIKGRTSRMYLATMPYIHQIVQSGGGDFDAHGAEIRAAMAADWLAGDEARRMVLVRVVLCAQTPFGYGLTAMHATAATPAGRGWR